MFKMKIRCELLVFIIFITVLYTYPQGLSTTTISTITTRYSNHRNYNLLPRRGKCGIQSLQEKVWGGNLTNIDEFPWMALLEYRANGKSTGFQCGGTLINDKYVVTAAHCMVGTVKQLYGDLFNIRFGEYDLDKKEDCISYPDGDKVCANPPVDIAVEELIPHPSYDDTSQNKYFDIALVRLKTPVKFSTYIKPICLPLNNEESDIGDVLTVSGWGQTERGVRSKIKLKADIPLIPNIICDRAYVQEVTITDTQLCAGGEEGIDSCNGDSGSPLMKSFPNRTDFYIEGIVSFGLADCGTRNVPGVYTRVTKYVDWILDNMKS